MAEFRLETYQSNSSSEIIKNGISKMVIQLKEFMRNIFGSDKLDWKIFSTHFMFYGIVRWFNLTIFHKAL